MSNPKFSICTTNYNCAHALSQHLGSIYSQLKEDEFEYIVVDSKSHDKSLKILEEYASSNENMSILQKKCVRGIGRQIAFKKSKGDYILQVDTDTIYLPLWRKFIDKCTEQYPELAVQAIFGGVYPRNVMEDVGGWRNFQWGDDLDLWMRVWEVGKMRWYPIYVGRNLKEEGTESYMDPLSQRYKGKLEKSLRLLRNELDWLKLYKTQELNITEIINENTIDLDLGEIKQLFKGGKRENLRTWFMGLFRKELKILRG